MKGLFRRSAAKKEVIAELRQNPFGGYGLYHIMNDAGLLSVNAKAELAPLIAHVEKRMDLSEEDLVVNLPLKFEPLTDEEHDTLTYVIAKALREFINTIRTHQGRFRLAAITGIIDMLERHTEHTASIHFEITLEELLGPILNHCGEQGPLSDEYAHMGRGFYIQLGNLERSGKFFPSSYVDERALQPGEVVCVTKKLQNNYFRVMRFNYACNYTQRWYLNKSRTVLSTDNAVAVVNRKEG
ncbi:MAG: hypothetical protein AB8G77_16270 [Rhodothermales bacterium]